MSLEHIVLQCFINCKVAFCFKTCFFNFHYVINCYFLIEISFLHDFTVGTTYLGNSVPDLFRKNAYEEVHFLCKAAMKGCTALVKVTSFICLFMV